MLGLTSTCSGTWSVLISHSTSLARNKDGQRSGEMFVRAVSLEQQILKCPVNLNRRVQVSRYKNVNAHLQVFAMSNGHYSRTHLSLLDLNFIFFFPFSSSFLLSFFNVEYMGLRRIYIHQTRIQPLTRVINASREIKPKCFADEGHLIPIFYSRHCSLVSIIWLKLRFFSFKSAG